LSQDPQAVDLVDPDSIEIEAALIAQDALADHPIGRPLVSNQGVSHSGDGRGAGDQEAKADPAEDRGTRQRQSAAIGGDPGGRQATVHLRAQHHGAFDRKPPAVLRDGATQRSTQGRAHQAESSGIGQHPQR
jgi:hypothetical protein